MSIAPEDNLLQRLARSDEDAFRSVGLGNAETPPASDSASRDAKVASLLQRLNSLASNRPGTADGEAAANPSSAAKSPGSDHKSAGEAKEFLPREPRSLKETGLTESEIEAIIFKYLLAKGDATGRGISDQLKLPFVLLEELYRRLKNEQMLVYRDTAPMGDYVYQLTDLGRERARRLAESATYFGAAPVPLADYCVSVKSQSLETQHPTQDDLRRAFSDLLIAPEMLDRLGPAINSGRGLFLFGAPGNGKTSIAERVTKAFGQYIWIPRSVTIDGEIMRVFDPVNHEEAPPDKGDGLLDQTRADKRWVRIKRPTIVVGGELTMDHLEVSFNPATGTSEAPVQLKSNCGTLVIDDFGRQRITTDQLLNRWIVPLEKRYDFLNLASGKKIQVPFDQLIIFSTNLEPKDLVDEAFLRRIPYKIEVVNPSEEAFRALFKIICPKMGFEYDEGAVEHLINKHYKAVNRPFRSCQPRDLMLQVRNHCFYQGIEPKLSTDNFDFAASNYFAVL